MHLLTKYRALEGRSGFGTMQLPCPQPPHCGFAVEGADELMWHAKSNVSKSLGIPMLQSTIINVSNFRDGMSYSKIMA